MADVDISTEAVERLASRVNTVADWRCYGAAATLRALRAALTQVEAAERRGMERAADILRREAGHWAEWSAGELAANAEAAIRAEIEKEVGK